ncbi:MAG: hypothetical protein FWE34_08565 [Defluviitaleaceae bacterium]|nr:hypothetical protein [Defluviitaleaceae bacterium]
MKKIRIVAVVAMLAMGLMLSSCNLADFINTTVSDVVQEVGGFAFSEMGGGETVTLGVYSGDFSGLYVSLANNAVTIHFHVEDMVRVDYSPPITGNYNVPNVGHDASGRIEITEPLNVTIDSNYRQPGMVDVFLPHGSVMPSADMTLGSTNGGVRVLGSADHLPSTIEISTINGIVEIGNFSAHGVMVTAVNGTISGNHLQANFIDFRTTNGVITLRDSVVFDELTARTINGGVVIENVSADMDRADLNAVNGFVTVR